MAVSKSLSRVAVLVVVAAVVLAGAYYAFFRPSNDKTVSAVFPEAVGVYPGTPVKILGVNVGTVKSVTPQVDGVKITMNYGGDYKLPAGVTATEVANSLVSDRYIQLDPVYTSGAVLKDGGSVINDGKHTASPAELDDIYSSLNQLSVALGPSGANAGGSKGPLSTLLDVASANLKGNGAALGNSITQLSKAARTLSDSKGDLFATIANLRTFTGALQQSDAQVRLFNTQLAQVAGDLASERSDLGAALSLLGQALDNVNSFVKTNAGKLHTTITGLEQVTKVLVTEKGSLEETLAVAPVALANIVHAYSPTVGGIATRSNLSSLTNPINLCGLINQSALTGLIPGVTDQLTQLANVCKGVLSGQGVSLANLGGLTDIINKTLPGLGSILSSNALGGGNSGLGLLTNGLTGGA